MSVRSCGLRRLSIPPNVTSSMKSLRYSPLVRSGGGPGRNCAASRNANGVTLPHWRLLPPVAEQPAVSCHCPGSEVDGRYDCGGADPSLLRSAIIAAAAASPVAIPSILAWLSAMPPSETEYAASMAVAWLAKYVRSTRCAAAAAAASGDAPGGATIVPRYGS